MFSAQHKATSTFHHAQQRILTTQPGTIDELKKCLLLLEGSIEAVRNALRLYRDGSERADKVVWYIPDYFVQRGAYLDMVHAYADTQQAHLCVFRHPGHGRELIAGVKNESYHQDLERARLVWWYNALPLLGQTCIVICDGHAIWQGLNVCLQDYSSQHGYIHTLVLLEPRLMDGAIGRLSRKNLPGLVHRKCFYALRALHAKMPTKRLDGFFRWYFERYFFASAIAPDVKSQFTPHEMWLVCEYCMQAHRMQSINLLKLAKLLVVYKNTDQKRARDMFLRLSECLAGCSEQTWVEWHGGDHAKMTFHSVARHSLFTEERDRLFKESSHREVVIRNGLDQECTGFVH